MPIKVNCECGQALVAKDSLAGKSAKCPKCSQPIPIPLPVASAAASSSVGATADNNGQASTAVQVRDAPPCPVCKQPFPEDLKVCTFCSYSRRLKRRLSQPRVEYGPQSAAAKKQERKPADSKPKPRHRRKLSTFNAAATYGGILVMVASALWLVVGLIAGYLFYYPFILFVIGFGAMLKGIFGEDPMID